MNEHEEKLHKVDQAFKALPKELQAYLTLGVFMGARGRVWRDNKGYHAKAYSYCPTILQPLVSALGGRLFSLKRGSVVWNLTGKHKCLWLAAQAAKLVPDQYSSEIQAPKPTKPGKGVCKHCGELNGPRGRHHPECIENTTDAERGE